MISITTKYDQHCHNLYELNVEHGYWMTNMVVCTVHDLKLDNRLIIEYLFIYHIPSNVGTITIFIINKKF